MRTVYNGWRKISQGGAEKTQSQEIEEGQHQRNPWRPTGTKKQLRQHSGAAVDRDPSSDQYSTSTQVVYGDHWELRRGTQP